MESWERERALFPLARRLTTATSRHTGKSRCKNRSPLPIWSNRKKRLAEKKSKREKEKKKKRRRKSGDGNVGRREPTHGFWHEAGHAGDKRSLGKSSKRFENLQNAQSSGPWIDQMEEPQKKQSWATPFTNPPPLGLAVVKSGFIAVGGFNSSQASHFRLPNSSDLRHQLDFYAKWQVDRRN
ncbi:hypothetical protein ASPBRDRAFT_401974 [Aspergillus brasiliensis CBS 101740]|uniref:Uncharacterized protein n=1 Tax=Aspergillus brasiliensis (strain CBS 101740 / IMI 381727 / IBT 21946) TaxID=767769 RepID=A0A1L9UX46_ASPBC|nr:hypothetical protein ASPBRDRAFT_401974 [Aspergillus brasiliensis CBS 101740]